MNESDKPNDPENPNVKAFEAGQARDLGAFEARQQEELRAFEQAEREQLDAFERHKDREYTIRIDRIEYHVKEAKLTGLQLRNLVTPPVGPDRDLFEVVPGGSDRKISDSMEVEMRDGLRFFTAPAQINPGSCD